jgi:glucosamine-6-phosphate deaminase
VQLQVFTDQDRLAETAADIVERSLSEFAGRALGVATGDTPLRVYAELVRRAELGVLDTGGTSVVALDEYVGVPASDPGSYAAYVRNRIARPMGITADRVAVLDGMALPETACADFERRIRELGGVGLQVAGIGSNGHLAFNEPGTPFDSRTHMVRLSEQTRRDNGRVFPSGDVPRFALTQGIGTVLEAQRILLVATGRRKAAAVARALEGPPDPSCPTSALQLHPDVVVLLDDEAASELSAKVPA